MKKKRKLIKIEWEEACESYLIDFYFETAPKENQLFTCGVGEHELNLIEKEIKRAKQKRKKK